MKLLLAVALGGAIGSVGRYYVIGAVERWLTELLATQFPYGTLAVNIIGSFLLGALIEVFAISTTPSPELRAFLLIGMLGGFTTFSAFSGDTVLLIERGELARAALYVGLSVVVSVAGLIAGMRLLRVVLG